MYVRKSDNKQFSIEIDKSLTEKEIYFFCVNLQQSARMEHFLFKKKLNKVALMPRDLDFNSA